MKVIYVDRDTNKTVYTSEFELSDALSNFETTLLKLPETNKVYKVHTGYMWVNGEEMVIKIEVDDIT